MTAVEISTSERTAELAANVRELLAYRAANRPSAPISASPFELVRASAIISRAESEAKRDPVERELRARIRGIGESLHAAGGIDAMHAAFDTVHEDVGGRAANIVDKAWDRIGSEWWA